MQSEWKIDFFFFIFPFRRPKILGGYDIRPVALNSKLRHPSSPGFIGSRIYSPCANKGARRKQTDCNQQFVAAQRRPHLHAPRQACNFLRPPLHARRAAGTQAVTVTRTRKWVEHTAAPQKVKAIGG